MRDQKTENAVRKQLQLEQYAWLNRRSLTASEARLWSALSARKLGVQFRRQVPLAGRFIVDFAAPSARLVIEVDGTCHARRRAADKRRDRALTALGWRVCLTLHKTLPTLRHRPRAQNTTCLCSQIES